MPGRVWCGLVAGADFKLFPFQEDAVDSLRVAALDWMTHAAQNGVPKYGSSVIPFLGQLRAVTGAGKTPILAQVVGGLGRGVVLWTSRSSAVIEQTYNNLCGRYAAMLPTGAKILRDILVQSEWRTLIDGEDGLTIWLLTVASWNEAESAAGTGSEEARLNLHRLHRDWAGDTSPWDQLRNDLKRPLWVVSDESHNQSTTQLDQLADLQPKGFFMASATPVYNERFVKWNEALVSGDTTWGQLASGGIVPVRTRDVVEAELLKTTLELLDFQSGREESLDGALQALNALDEAAADEKASVRPRAIYVVEKSNPMRGTTGDPPPVIIWRYLRSKGVSADEIAIYTDTRSLPEEAEKVSSLSGLHERYRHIIFNQTLQEGWDDPEAYVCYFDGVTKSFTRIKQIVGRVLRQPGAQHFKSELLNTATIVLNVPADSYDSVLSELRAEMRLYASDDEPDVPVIKVKTRREPLEAIPVKVEREGTLKLPNRTLKAPGMVPAVRMIEAAGRVWPEEELDAPGRGRRTVVSLEREEQEKDEYMDVVRSARTRNGAFLRRYIQHRNRGCVNAIHPDSFKGSGFKQESCLGSLAQAELRVSGDRVVDYYEEGVEYQIDPDPENAYWVLGEHRPRGKDSYGFANAAHPRYATLDMNRDEREFASALDGMGVGTWARNASTATTGFGIPLPTKVDGSSRFYPDFLWWLGADRCWALDTTGQHLLNAKVRGKLIALQHPQVAFIVRGGVDLATNLRIERTGWSLVRPRQARPPKSEHFEDLHALLSRLLESRT
jgi:type III restriction enzyme